MWNQSHVGMCVYAEWADFGDVPPCSGHSSPDCYVQSRQKKNGGNASSVDCPGRLSSAFLDKELRIRSMGTLDFVLCTFKD